MIKVDKNALMCDLAETYQIYDFEQLPLSTVAVFSVGLKNTSRIKMKMSKQDFDIETMLLMSMSDSLKMILWSKTKDAQKGKNRPVLWSSLLEKPKEKKEIVFNSGEDFENERNRLLRKGGHN